MHLSSSSYCSLLDANDVVMMKFHTLVSKERWQMDKKKSMMLDAGWKETNT